MRLELEWMFNIEGKTPEEELRIMKGVCATLKNSAMRIWEEPVMPHEVYLYDSNTKAKIKDVPEKGDPVPNALIIFVDV